MKYPEFDKKYFNLIKRYIDKNSSLKIFEYSQNFVKRRIYARMNRNNLDTYKQYYSWLRSHDGEIDKFFKSFSIHVSHFFRDKNFYDLFYEQVIPIIVNQNKESKKIKIWSIGCSTGQEPYSLSILFHEYLKNKIENYDIDILATDIDRGSLKIARKGKYKSRALKETKLKYIKRYFREFKGYYKVNNDVKSLVRFQEHDILKDVLYKNRDIICCRNVVIYFEKSTKIELYQNIYDVLNNNGFYIMGKTETLMGQARNLFEVFDSHEKIYIKR